MNGECTHYPILICSDCGAQLSGDLSIRLADLEAENARLKEALQGIADWTGNDYCMRGMAREALQENTK